LFFLKANDPLAVLLGKMFGQKHIMHVMRLAVAY
jgi:hypothetical protein